MSSTVQSGDSGSLVFSGDNTFLGMVWGYAFYENETSGLGIGTKSGAFLASLEDYLLGQDRAGRIASLQP